MKREKIKIRDRVLEVCSHGDCESCKIWDYPTCWDHLTKLEKSNLVERIANILRDNKDLNGIVLTGADLSEIDFSGANLSNTFLNGCTLIRCKFQDSNLKNAFLGASNLEQADLTRATLSGAVFSGANLNNVKLLAYSIRFEKKPVNLAMECFGSKGIFKRPKIDESEPYFARATYQALKNYFLQNGDYDAAGWASYCERLMQQKNYWKEGNVLNWISSLIFNITCGHGEKPSRVVVFVSFIITLYALIYKSLALINHYPQTTKPIAWLDALYFSAATFSTITFPDIIPINNSGVKLFVVSEAFWGIFALSLFVFALTKKYVAR